MAAVTVPDIGDFSDIPVIEILVAVGDAVAKDQALVTLESEKATFEVPSPQAGTVTALHVKLGDTVSEGSAILDLDAVGAGDAAPAVASEPAAAPDPAAAPSRAAAADAAAPPPEPVGAAPTAGPVHASPAVRRAARERRIDLATVSGSGRRGRITLGDLDRLALGAPGQPAVAPAGALPGLAPWPKVDFAKYGEIERVPRSRINKIAAPNLARNWVMIPHVTHHEDADITDLEALRKTLNAEHPETKVTMVALLMKACASSLHAFPDFNASLDGDDLVRKLYYHVGFAADTPQGLVVPVIRDVDQKGLLDIATELRALSEKAREGKLAPAEMAGGTFTISSLGGIGGTGFTPIVNAPEVAILGVTKSAIRPVWDGSAFVPRLIVPLSLSYDHRVIDGAAAARFMVHLADVLSDMRRALL